MFLRWHSGLETHDDLGSKPDVDTLCFVLGTTRLENCVTAFVPDIKYERYATYRIEQFVINASAAYNRMLSQIKLSILTQPSMRSSSVSTNT